MRFLALGDSYTIGQGVTPSERWPVQLANLLRPKGLDLAEPTIIATTGWTTDELLAGIERADPQGPYDLASLLIGVNNQYRGRSPDEYRQEFVTLLQRAIALVAGRPSRMLVLSIPDWSVTPFAAGRDRAATSADIDRFNAINRQEAERASAHYFDVTPISRRAAQDPSLITHDGLHPSGRMYAEWAHLVLPVATQVLGSK